MASDLQSPCQATLCARAPEPASSTSRPLVPSIDLSVVYCPADLDHVDALSEGTAAGFIYARDGHPNASQLALKMARLERGEAGLVCASGMGAIASVFLAHLSQNDHVLVAKGVYGKTTALVTRQLPRWGITHDFFDAADAGSLVRRLTPKTRLVFVETVSNPLLGVADLDSLASVTREAGIPLAVDNTFAPLLCRPIERGATFVVHSATKMIGGHSDLTLGVLVGPSRFVEPIRALASTLGQTGNPFESWLALRGLATLSVRMHRASSTALELARRLEGHPKVNRVHYPGLESHPEFTLAGKLLSGGFGAMVTVDLGTRRRAESLIRGLVSIPFAPSLGDVQTTLSHPATTSHRGQDEAQLAAQGVTAGMIRISVGLEDVEDLWGEIKRGVEGVEG
jgi:cystathionine beta-lyase/cystathionine gamma-synthase